MILEQNGSDVLATEAHGAGAGAACGDVACAARGEANGLPIGRTAAASHLGAKRDSVWRDLKILDAAFSLILQARLKGVGRDRTADVVV